MRRLFDWISGNDATTAHKANLAKVEASIDRNRLIPSGPIRIELGRLHPDDVRAIALAVADEMELREQAETAAVEVRPPSPFYRGDPEFDVKREALRAARSEAYGRRYAAGWRRPFSEPAQSTVVEADPPPGIDLSRI